LAHELAKITGGQVRDGGGRTDGWRIWGRHFDIEVNRWGGVKFTAGVEADRKDGTAGQIARMLATLLPDGADE